jgi:hypothetical protein
MPTVLDSWKWLEDMLMLMIVVAFADIKKGFVYTY